MVTSSYTAQTIAGSLGAPEYSYWFVRRAFAPVLERFGIVVPVTDPAREVDAIAASAAARGQDAVFFSFEPPHKTELGLQCRTIPVFAWEFDTIPDEPWDEEPRHDWRRVLHATGSAITHSRFAVHAVRRTMGEDYPVWCIPAPVFDTHTRFAHEARPVQPQSTLTISGFALDCADVDPDYFSVRRAYADGMDALRRLAHYIEQPGRPPQRLHVAGVVYTAIFNPVDGRKNFNDMLGAFIWAFRNIADATLILKITYSDPVRGLQPALADIAKHGIFACRVLLIHGMLPEDEYQALVRLTSYAVNTASNEGQCLPLMEFMSAGRPAVAPAHTAMLDYLNGDNAFIVRSSAKPFMWPHDPREAIRTHRNVLSFADLVRAFRDSYVVAKTDPDRYAAMSRAANAAMRRFCSGDIVQQRLGEVLAAAATPTEPALHDEDRD